MKVRIGGFNGQYWVEIKTFLRWKKAPMINHYIRCLGILPEDISRRFDPDYTFYTSDYEQARRLADTYLMRFGKNVAVYSGVLK